LDDEKKKFYKEIIEYRALMRNSFKEYIQENKPLELLVEKTNNILIKSQTHPLIQKNEQSYSLEFVPKKTENLLLTKIAIELVKLLSSKEFKYLKKCDNHKCSLYFIDTSKNHSRRWCSMEICGNRAKVSKFNKKKTIKI